MTSLNPERQRLRPSICEGRATCAGGQRGERSRRGVEHADAAGPGPAALVTPRAGCDSVSGGRRASRCGSARSPGRGSRPASAAPEPSAESEPPPDRLELAGRCARLGACFTQAGRPRPGGVRGRCRDAGAGGTDDAARPRWRGSSPPPPCASEPTPRHSPTAVSGPWWSLRAPESPEEPPVWAVGPSGTSPPRGPRGSAVRGGNPVRSEAGSRDRPARGTRPRPGVRSAAGFRGHPGRAEAGRRSAGGRSLQGCATWLAGRLSPATQAWTISWRARRPRRTEGPGARRSAEGRL